jgi:hypothetical protein
MMFLFRFLSFLAGILVFVVPPLFLFENSTGPQFFDGRTVLATMAALGLVALSFFYIGFAGDKMRKSLRLRWVGGVLLCVPSLGGAVTLCRGGEDEVLWMSALMFGFSVLLFVNFVYPATHMRRQRPMRRRESLPR